MSMRPDNEDAFSKFLAEMKNGEVAIVRIEGNDLAIYPARWEKLKSLLESGMFIGAIGDTGRPGHAFFQRYLELTYFHPQWDDHEFMQVIFLRWGDMLWSITLLPVAYKDKNDQPHYGHELINEAAKVARLRVIPHALPAMVGGGMTIVDDTSKPAADPQLARLGFISPNLPEEVLCTLENEKDHLVYTDPKAAGRQQEEDIAKLEAAKL